MGEGDLSALDSHRGNLPAGEERRHLVRVLRLDRAEQVDASVELREPAGGEPRADVLSRHPGLAKLQPRNHPELPPCKRSDYAIREMRS